MIFGTFVKIIAGFYIGCTGFVMEKDVQSNYLVELTCEDQWSKIHYTSGWFRENEMEIQK